MACPGGRARGHMAQDLGLAGAMWVLPSCSGGDPTSPCRSCPRSRGLRLEASKAVSTQVLVLWSLSHSEQEQFFASSTSPTHVLKPFDKFQNETRAPSTEQEQSSHFKLGRPCTIRGLSDTINIRQIVSNRGTFSEIQDFSFQV